MNRSSTTIGQITDEKFLIGGVKSFLKHYGNVPLILQQNYTRYSSVWATGEPRLPGSTHHSTLLKRAAGDRNVRNTILAFYSRIKPPHGNKQEPCRSQFTTERSGSNANMQVQAEVESARAAKRELIMDNYPATQQARFKAQHAGEPLRDDEPGLPAYLHGVPITEQKIWARFT